MVYTVKIYGFSKSRCGRNAGDFLLAEEDVDQGRLSHVRAAQKGYFGKSRHRQILGLKNAFYKLDFPERHRSDFIIRML